MSSTKREKNQTKTKQKPPGSYAPNFGFKTVQVFERTI
jgi:hypothetical protein